MRLKRVLKRVPGLTGLYFFLGRFFGATFVPKELPAIKERWDRGTRKEAGFWDEYLREQQGDFSERIRDDTELERTLVDLLPSEPADRLRIIDVGAGPLTALGKRINGVPLQMHATDALGDAYDESLQENGLVPPVRTIACPAEALTSRFETGSFDLVFCQNALDHTYDPIKALDEMIAVMKDTGVIYLRHFENEGRTEGYHGLHSWNITVEDGDVVIWNPKHRTNVTQRLSGFSVEAYPYHRGKMLVVVIRRA